MCLVTVVKPAERRRNARRRPIWRVPQLLLRARKRAVHANPAECSAARQPPKARMTVDRPGRMPGTARRQSWGVGERPSFSACSRSAATMRSRVQRGLWRSCSPAAASASFQERKCVATSAADGQAGNSRSHFGCRGLARLGVADQSSRFGGAPVSSVQQRRARTMASAVHALLTSLPNGYAPRIVGTPERMCAAGNGEHERAPAARASVAGPSGSPSIGRAPRPRVGRARGGKLLSDRKPVPLELGEEPMAVKAPYVVLRVRLSDHDRFCS